MQGGICADQMGVHPSILLTLPVPKYAFFWLLRCDFVLLGCHSFHQSPCLCLSCLSSSHFPRPPTLLDSFGGSMTLVKHK